MDLDIFPEPGGVGEGQEPDDADNSASNDNEDDLEELEKDTYIGYKPCKVLEGRSHPDPIVETQTLAAVVPPDPHYQHHLQDLLERGEISDAQLETVIYACMRFEQRLKQEEEEEEEEEDQAGYGGGGDQEGGQQQQPPPGEAHLAPRGPGPNGAAAAGFKASPPPTLRPRAGFFLGDGAGVGKGRQIGALIRECWHRGVRRVLWVSVSTDLKEDAARDLTDTGATAAGVKLYPQGKGNTMPGSHESLERSFQDGVLFVTYSLLIGKGVGVTSGGAALRQFRDAANMGPKDRAKMEKVFRRDPLQFYPPGSRLNQIVDWLQRSGTGEEGHQEQPDEGQEGRGECLIVLDECHRAKNLLLGPDGTQTGRAVEALQLALPNARVLYSSATGATEPQNLAYMLRLGHKGFESMRDLSMSLQAAGLGALELFSSGMKALGTYVNRTLSYSGAEFIVEHADIEPEYRVMYDRAAQFWQLLYKITKNLPNFGDKRDSMRMRQFWSSHQRFFRLMLIACKVNRCAQLARQAVSEGLAVVIGLQSTGEANMDQVRDVEGDELEDFVSSPQVQISNFITRFFPGKVPRDVHLEPEKLDRLVFQVKVALDAYRPLPSAAAEVRLNGGSNQQQQPAEEEGAGAAGAGPGGDSGSGGGGGGQDPAGDLPETGDPGAPGRLRAAAGAAACTPMVGAGGLGVQDATAAGVGTAAPAAPTPAPAATTTTTVHHHIMDDSDDDILEMTEVVTTPAPGNPGPRQPLCGRQHKTPAAGAAAAAAAAVKTENVRPKVEVKPEGKRAQTTGHGKALEPLVIHSDGNEDEELGARGPGGGDAASGAMGTGATGSSAAPGCRGFRANGGLFGGGWDGLDEEGDQPSQHQRQAPVAADAVAARRGDLIDLGYGGDDVAARRLVAELQREELRAQEEGRGAAREAARADLAAKEQALKIAMRRVQLLESGKDGPDNEGAAEPPAKRRRRAGAGAAPCCDACGGSGGPCGASGGSSGITGANDQQEGTAAAPNPLLLCAEPQCGSRLHLRCWDPTADEVPLGSWLCPDCVAKRAQRRMAGASEYKRRTALVKFRTEVAEAEAAVAAARAELRRLEAPLDSNGSGDPAGRSGQHRAAAGGSGAGDRGDQEAIEVEEDFSLDALLASAVRPPAKVKTEARVVTDDDQQAAGGPRRRGRPRKDGAAATTAAATATGWRRRSSGEGAGSSNGGLQTPGGRRLPGAEGGTAGSGPPPSSLSYAVKARQRPMGVSEQMVETGSREGREGEEDEDRPVYVPQLALVRKLLLEFVGERVELPPTPLDRLVELLGGSGQVAEMTGRKGRLEKDEDGKVRYHDRSQQLEEARKRVNLTERRAFMSGRKLIALISDAASTGVSLHANRREANQRRRFHITLELPWSADRAIQQFGRSHRANQASAPIYCLLVSKCGGEYRFAGSVARRLQSLGALLQGDRNALGATRDLKAFDVTSPWGKAAIAQLYFECKLPELPAMPGVVTPFDLYVLQRAGASPAAAAAAAAQAGAGGNVPEPVRRQLFMPYIASCLTKVGLEKNIQKANPRNPSLVDHSEAGERRVEIFLNRLLGIPLDDQQRVFDYFWGLMAAIIAHAKATGLYDYGIRGLEGRSVMVRHLQVIHTEEGSGAKAFYARVEADRGVPWSEALAAYEQAVRLCGNRPDPRIGFYVERPARNQGGTGRPLVLLATPLESERLIRRTITWFRIRRPNGTGRKGDKCLDDHLRSNYELIPLQRAQQLWDFWFDFLRTHCIHGYNCNARAYGGRCNRGQRVVTHHIVSGAVIPIWRHLSDVIALTHQRDAAAREEEAEEEGASHRSSARRKRGPKWPACVRVLGRVPQQVAAQARAAGMRLVAAGPTQPGSGGGGAGAGGHPAAAFTAAAGPSTGGPGGTAMVAAEGAMVLYTGGGGVPAAAAAAGPSGGGDGESELLFVGLDLQGHMADELMGMLAGDRNQQQGQGRQQQGKRAGAAPGAAAAAAGPGGGEVLLLEGPAGEAQGQGLGAYAGGRRGRSGDGAYG